ncbi:hypothetical protein BKA82DRAFT_4153564 [Pisolithus tinctorius]|nr:hypothetical protein BKA82DRAFT_4153564 [Pisolithus tinctorius]
MADSFADLWTSSAPVKQTQQPQRLGASSAPKPNPPSQRPQWDAFSALSASQPTSRTHLPLQAQIQQKPVAVSQRQNVSSDAFSGLFDASMGFGSGSAKEATNMSMAEKATLAQKGKAQQAQLENGRISSQSAIPSAWDGLDSLAQTTIPVMSSAVKSPPQDDFDFTFGCAKATQKIDSGVSQDEGDWGLSDFSSPHPSAQLKAQPKVQSLWDIDDFASPSPQRSQTDSPVSSNLTVRNDRENALFDGNVREDDILGDLCKPVQNHSIRPSPPPQLAPVPSTAQQLSRTPTTSPPPHITGQLVEMGFSPQTARSALVSTCTPDGFDVQAALDWLLAHREASSPSESDNRRSEGLDSETVHRTSRGPPTRATRKPSHLGSRNAQQRQPNSDTADFPASTERFLSQAGEIGRGMFSRANALFKEGKERAVKMYEERTGASSTRVAGSANGRPRWMREGSGEGELREDKPQGDFKDENHESKSCKSRSLRSSPGDIQFQASPPATTEEVDLFSNDASQIVHQSLPPKGKPNAELTPSTSNSTSSLLTDPQSTTCTEAYKLGQYPAAAAAYSRALASVPEGHVLRLPLLTNRAAALSKVGELSGVVEDCSAAIALTERYMSKADTANAKIGRMHVVVEATSGTEEGTEVDLAGGLTKAYQRRAEAYEGLEKWARALADWKWAGAARSLATSGIARCRRMVDGGDQSAPDGTKRRPGIRPSVSPTVVPQLSKPRPKHSTVSPSIGTGESSAVVALRAAADVAASEDAERKETNIRALLTTLDSVLWPELGWKKVKVAYMRAIARVHPDKLNADNTTIEQQMIASGVFGTLNQAWNAFLQQ